MKKAYFCVVITALLFGTMEVACKIGGSSLDPFQLTFLRFLIGGCVLLPFAITHLKRNKIRINGKDLLSLAGVGFLGVTEACHVSVFNHDVQCFNRICSDLCESFLHDGFGTFLYKREAGCRQLGILAWR